MSSGAEDTLAAQVQALQRQLVEERAKVAERDAMLEEERAKAEEERAKAEEETRKRIRTQQLLQEETLKRIKSERQARISTLSATTVARMPAVQPLDVHSSGRSSHQVSKLLTDVQSDVPFEEIMAGFDPLLDEDQICREVLDAFANKTRPAGSAVEKSLVHLFVKELLTAIEKAAKRRGLPVLKSFYESIPDKANKPDISLTLPPERIHCSSNTVAVIEIKPFERSEVTHQRILREGGGDCVSYLANRQELLNDMPSQGTAISIIGGDKVTLLVVRIDFRDNKMPIRVSKELLLLGALPPPVPPAPVVAPVSLGAESALVEALQPVSPVAEPHVSVVADSFVSPFAPEEAVSTSSAAVSSIPDGLRALVRILFTQDLASFGLEPLSLSTTTPFNFAGSSDWVVSEVTTAGEGGFATVYRLRFNSNLPGSRDRYCVCKMLRDKEPFTHPHTLFNESRTLIALERAGVPHVPRVVCLPGLEEEDVVVYTHNGRECLLMQPLGTYSLFEKEEEQGHSSASSFAAAVEADTPHSVDTSSINTAIVTLDTLDRRRVRFAIRAFCCVWEALNRAHSAAPTGFLHGDVRPANLVRIDETSVLLIDWGLSEKIETPMNSRDIKHMIGRAAFFSDRKLDLLIDKTNSSWKPSTEDDLDAAVWTFFALLCDPAKGFSRWPDSSLLMDARAVKNERGEWVRKHQQLLFNAAAVIDNQDPSAKNHVSKVINAQLEGASQEVAEPQGVVA